MRVIAAGGFLKSYIEGLLAATVAFLVTMPGVGDGGVSLFLGAGSVAHIAFTLASGFLVRKVGPRRLMMASAVLPIFAVGFYVLPTYGVLTLAVGNAVKGVSFGILTAVSPLLIVEKSEVEKRGKGAALFQVSMQIGVVVGALGGAGVAALFGHRPSLAVDIDFLLMLGPVLWYLLATFRLPEVAAPVRRMSCSFRLHRNRFRTILSAVGFMFLMSATGVGTVMNFSVVMFNDAGFSGASANLADVILRALPIAAVVGVAGLVDRVGRVVLLRASVFLMAVGFAGAAVSSGVAFAAFLLLAVTAFSGGFGVCAWVVVPEMLPEDVRAQGTSLALVTGQIATCVMITLFPQVRTLLGNSYVFGFFAAVSAAAYFYFGGTCKTL